MIQSIPPATVPQKSGPSVEAIRNAAQKLEATFLSEMLKASGLGETRSGFGGGGIGEEQFNSFLVSAQADEMVRAGGIGLSDALFQSLMESYHDPDV